MIASLTQRFPTPAWQLALSVRSRFSLNTTSMSTPVLAQNVLDALELLGCVTQRGLVKTNRRPGLCDYADRATRATTDAHKPFKVDGSANTRPTVPTRLPSTWLKCALCRLLQHVGWPRSEKSFAQKAANVVTTREGLVSDHDYAFLFKPNLSFSKKRGGRLPSLG